jgi:ketosteroid isomerase-like protein
MLKYVVFVSSLGLILGCGQAKRDRLNSELLAVDKQWSELSQTKGFYHSRMDFAEDSSIEIEEYKMPVIGRKGFEDDIAAHPDSNFCLGWTPLRAEIASSGDLGYTFGGFAYRTKTKRGIDTVYYGNYITVWHKQPDGKWKFLIDGGTDTPGPITKLK